MGTVTAIYEHGVFRPLEKVDLPEHARVRVTVAEDPAPAVVSPGLAAIYEAMDFRYDGEADDAARVDPARK